MNHKTTVIFDMDGVIFDSETMYMNELMAFYKKYDIDLLLDEYKQVICVDNRKFRDIVYGWWNEKTSREEFNDLLTKSVSYTHLDVYKRQPRRLGSVLWYVHHGRNAMDANKTNFSSKLLPWNIRSY